MNTLIRIIAMLLSFIPSVVQGEGVSLLFKHVSETRWETDHSDKWYRKYVVNEGVYIVIVWLTPQRLQFRSWKECAQPDKIDEVVWFAGDELGKRMDCDGKHAWVTTPQYWEEVLDDFPRAVRDAIRRTRETRRPEPRVVLRS